MLRYLCVCSIVTLSPAFGDVVQIDFSGSYNRDCILNGTVLADVSQDSADASDHVYATVGLIGLLLGSGPGLPGNGAFAATSNHPPVVLGYREELNGENCIRFGGPGDPAEQTVPVTPAQYTSLHLFYANTEGAGSFSVDLRYTDVTNSFGPFVSSDWTSDPPAAGEFYLIDGMDYATLGVLFSVQNIDDVAIFGRSLQVDSTRNLTGIRIHSHSGGRLLVFGATANTLEIGTTGGTASAGTSGGSAGTSSSSGGQSGATAGSSTAGAATAGGNTAGTATAASGTGSSATAGQATVGNSSSGGTSAGDSSGSATAGVATGGDGNSLLPWTIEIKRPKHGSSVRFSPGSRGLGSFSGTVRGITMPMRSSGILVEVRVVGSNVATSVWFTANKIGVVSRKGTLKFKARNLGNRFNFARGHACDVQFRATEPGATFLQKSSPTTTVRVTVR